MKYSLFLFQIVPLAFGENEDVWNLENVDGEFEELNAMLTEHKDKWVAQATSMMTFTAIDENKKNGGCTSNCCKCLREGVGGIMKYVYEEIETFCKETKCEKAQKMCEWAKNHPEFSTGFIAEKVRPLSLSAAWCNGARNCRSAELTLETIGDAVFDDDSDGIVQAESSLPEIKEEDLLEIVNSQDDNDMDTCPKENDRHLCEGKGNECGLHGKRFTCCVTKVSEAVMKVTARKAAAWCQKTTCPFGKRACAWAGNNQKVACGMMVAKVEPWKFGYGYCWPHRRGGHHRRHHDQPEEPENFVQEILA